MVTNGDGSTVVEAVRHGAVLLLTLNGPSSRNAMGPAVYQQIQTQLISAGSDPTVRAVVLTGADKFFSSGGNVRALQGSAKGTLAEATGNTDKLNAMVKAIIDCPVPLIAAVEGGVAGAAVSAVLACDMIVASRDAKFTVAHVRVGLSPDGGVTHLLRSALPRQMIMQMCLLGEPASAATLATAGLVNMLTDDGGALQAALALAQRLAEGPPLAMANIKQLINAAPEVDLATHLDREARAINLARFGPEAAEGLSAFLEKRRPDFGAARKSGEL
ncbi:MULTISPECIES: enoyl-CoA hydratase family protein [Rhodopseudomonas]|uniref:Enoyl-CoA hydratase n=1 Tax=Rhodopseudomonas palustris TaxID=1076 RepID=A0A0D7F5V0_RHOPL|nr:MULTISPECIES: enoyl-CoA hydratase family protein [Rhodopseudomonas]KIZ48161.1 enoyl-CoA hydratase [Rhodopseudomonas palustris]MDF3812049.1 enoyl-CoA hydratase family protein [Rhodopseudomonas sp. BAL398]WOK16091.1 enoyl-CoA hydratase family protein [Rhodopseudomonas sp. BAL398]